jgi:predicted permease
MLMDFRHLLRHLRRSPASAAAAVLTLSLTLGAGTAIVAVVDAVLLTPPPIADPDAVVTLGERLPDDQASAPRPISFDTLDAWRARAQSLAVIEASDGTNLTLTGLGAAERVSVSDVTPGYLALLGLAPVRGRTFVADDAGQPVVIVSAAFWTAKLGGDAGAVGRSIVLGGRPHTIVGVLADRRTSAFTGDDLWRPLALPAPGARGGARLAAVARLSPGVSTRELEGRLDEVSRRAVPAAHAVATPIALAINGAARPTLRLLAAAAALACLIAFVNLAGLLLMRAIDRRRELAVRTALGARRWEIVRQLSLEAVTLVALGLAGGVFLAWWLTPLVGALALEQFGPIANRELAVSWRAIGVMAIAAGACAGLCGVLPVVLVARRETIDVLSRGTTAAPRELRARRAFVSAVVAIACVLLVSLTLLGRSLAHVLATDPGFDARGVLAVQVSLPPAAYPGAEQLAAFYVTL